MNRRSFLQSCAGSLAWLAIPLAAPARIIVHKGRAVGPSCITKSPGGWFPCACGRGPSITIQGSLNLWTVSAHCHPCRQMKASSCSQSLSVALTETREIWNLIHQRDQQGALPYEF